MPAYLVLGLFIGVLGIAYNRAILGDTRRRQRHEGCPRRSPRRRHRRDHRESSPGSLPLGSAAATTSPNKPSRPTAIAILPAFFAVRFALGAVSYAAGTPGGLFAPMLVLGAQAGLFFGYFATRWFPVAGTDPTAYAVTGMAAFFTAVVRCPVTGIILVIELTASDTQLLSMLAACFTAMLVPTLAGNPPIYDSLGSR